jgi:hypothetical protein
MYNPLNVELPAGYTASVTDISYQEQLLREDTLSPQDWLDEAEGDLALATDMVVGIAAHFAYNCAAAHRCVRQVLGEDGLYDETTGIRLRYRHDLHANRLEIHYFRHDKPLFRENYSMPDLYVPHAFREDPDLQWLLADIREDFYELVAWNVVERETAAQVLETLAAKRW